MKVTHSWRAPQLSTLRVLACIGLALLAVISGGTFAWHLLGQKPKSAHAASSINYLTTHGQPWGMVIDSTDTNLWVAEPNCDGNPYCGSTGGTPPPGSIGEYNVKTFLKTADFVPPAPASYNPMFIALNAGNLWFSDPTNHAIGELIPATNTWMEKVIPGSYPVGIAFDKNGNLWYSDYATGAVGEFNTSTLIATETPMPTAGTSPYGMTIAPDGVTVWFTENSLSSVGSFTAPASGTLTTAAIKEYPFTGPKGTTPHLITTDSAGIPWFSTGFGGQVAEVKAGVVTTFCVSNGVANPHISGIGIDSTGKVWFDDSLNSRIGYLTPANYANDCNNGSSAGVTYTILPNSPHTHDGLIVDKTNTVFFGEQYNDELGQILAGATLPPPASIYPPGPTNNTWYFAEGRVGGGFQEYITIGNPSIASTCIVDITYLREGGTSIAKKITVNPASRYTVAVNADLNVAATSVTGTSVSVMLQNDPISPCIGFAAERPMYFNYHGNQSDSDVVGATHLNTNFYFADIPSGGGITSYITILNPPKGQTATVTATYYAKGVQVGQQVVSVPAGQRGTIAPGAISLPQHSAAVVTSSQPVVIERPTYFSNINGGNAGTVTGAASVIGSQKLQNEFFFAEGYTGPGFQENLVISNVDAVANATANVTINLEYLNGTKHSFNVTVAPKSQLIWNVNTNGTSPGSPEVSADVTSIGAAIVAARQEFFHYQHTLPLPVVGGSEVTGLATQISTSASYSFAEGYSNKGFNEWLTLQNPTATPETIYITMVNGYGRVFTLIMHIGANTRANVDVTAQVLINLVKPGDDHRGYEVSMTVQTLTNGGFFVVERPMYINTSGASFPTQGGNDAFGYNGQ